MADERTPGVAERDKGADLDRLLRRLDMLDQRLDNIDSVVTAVVERVMKQPISLSVTCPGCGHAIEVALIGTEKPGG